MTEYHKVGDLFKKKNSSHFWRLESRRSRGLHLTRKHSQDDSTRSFRREELSWQNIWKTPPLNTATVRFTLSRYELRGTHPSHTYCLNCRHSKRLVESTWLFPDLTNLERGVYLKKNKKPKAMILLPASEMHQLFLRISRHSTSSASSWASVLIHLSEVHETSLRWCLTLSHWPLRDVHPPPPIVILGTFKEAITRGCRSGCCPLFKTVKRNHTTLPQERKQISFLSNGTKESELFVSPRWLSPSKEQLIWLCGGQPSKCQTANGKSQSKIHSWAVIPSPVYPKQPKQLSSLFFRAKSTGVNPLWFWIYFVTCLSCILGCLLHTQSFNST